MYKTCTSESGTVRDSLAVAVHIKEVLDIEVVRGDDDLDEHLLVDGDEVLDPFAYVRWSLASVVLLLKDREVGLPPVPY